MGLLWTAVLALVYAAVRLLEGRGVLLPYHVQILSLCCINIILVVSLNLINGFTGQFSIGHAGFFAIVAYLSAYLTVKLQVPFVPALLCGGLLAGLTGIAVEMCIRDRGGPAAQPKDPGTFLLPHRLFHAGGDRHCGGECGLDVACLLYTSRTA